MFEVIRVAGLRSALSGAPAPCRLSRARHDQGKVRLDVAIAVALGVTAWSMWAAVRAQCDLFGIAASDPTFYRLFAALTADAATADADARLLSPLRHGDKMFGVDDQRHTAIRGRQGACRLHTAASRGRRIVLSPETAAEAGRPSQASDASTCWRGRGDDAVVRYYRRSTNDAVYHVHSLLPNIICRP
jgi:hypothetical protein